MTPSGDAVPAALAPLPAAYRSLFDRAAGVLADDQRVRALWLGGSLARGSADAASDLDLLVAVADEHHEAFAKTWRSLLAAITPTVLAEEQWFAKGSFWSITPAFERLDLVVEPASAIPTTPFPVRCEVFDRDGLTALLPAELPRSPSPTTVARLVRDWFHFSAMLETILWRDDWLLAGEHLHFLRGRLYDLYVEANQPLPPMGLKRWTEKLTAEQAGQLGALPVAADSAQELIGAHLSLSEAFLTTARPLAAAVGAEWPTELEDATRRHVREVIGVQEPYPWSGGGASRP